MKPKHAIVVPIFCLILAGVAAAAVVETEIPSTTGYHRFTLDAQIGEVQSVWIRFGGEAQDFHFDCQNSYPGGDVNYEHWAGYHVWFEIESDGMHAADDWFAPNGAFEDEVRLWHPSDEGFLASGTGRFYYQMWVDLFPPEEYDCGNATGGYLIFYGPITLSVEYTPAVPNEPSAWGGVKALYR